MTNSIIIPRITDNALKDFQVEAVKEATKKLNRRHGVLLHGTTGSGKTAIAITVARMQKRPKDKFTITLVIVPSISGNLPKQWMKEGVRWGIPRDNLFLFHGKERENFNFFIKQQHAETCNQMLFVVTTPETCVTELKKKTTTFCTTHWAYVISDEAHMWRNGTNKMKDHEIVDPDKKRYSLITDKIVKHSSPLKPRPLVILLTATPYKNNYMDYFAYMHWLSPRQPDKKKWTYGRKKDQPNEYKMFLEEKDPLLEKHVVHIKPPKMPLPTVHMVEHGPTNAEYDALILTHINVNKATQVYVKAISAYSTVKNHINYERMQRAQKAWVSALTRAKRQILHPGFKEVALPVLNNEHIDSEVLIISKQKILISDGENTSEIACDFRLTEEENKQQVVNLHGYIKYIEYESRDDSEMPKIKGKVQIESNGEQRYLFPNPFEQLDWKKYKQEWPLENCSRFKATIDLIKQLEGKKIMLVSMYRQPLQLLAEYIYEEIPTVTLLQHYGGRNNSDLIEQFHQASDSETIILMATRSSISEGVDITCCNHMICLDPASTFADDKQMKGRMIRPYAKLFPEYNTYDMTLSSSGDSGFVDNWVLKMQKQKGVEAAQFVSNEDGDELMHDEESSSTTLSISSLQLLTSMLTSLTDDFCNEDDRFESLSKIQAQINQKRKAEQDNDSNKKQKTEHTGISTENNTQNTGEGLTRTERLIQACDAKNKYEYNRNLEIIRCAARAAARRRVH